MSRINTNVPALVAQHRLARSNEDLKTRLERLSTGLQINRGADNPAGLIVSERLRTEISSVGQVVNNAERAANVIATAEAALGEISDLLTDIKGLIVEAANTGAFSEEEIEANQLQIDSAVESITRISNTTSFAGMRLLNGSLDYVLSGVDSANIQDVKVHGANFGLNANLPVTVEVLNSAETGTLFISAANPAVDSAILSSVSFEIQGTRGVEVFEFVSGTRNSAIVFAINSVKDATGVSASLVNTSGIALTSTEFGSDAFVSVRKLEDGDSFKVVDGLGGNEIARDAGEDVLALVNGNLALGDGRNVSLRSSTVNISMTLTPTAAQTLTSHRFTVTGGGAMYQIGPEVSSNQQIGVGLQSVAASHLGNEALGFLNSITSGGDNSLVAGGSRNASDIVDAAIDQIAIMRGRLGAFERNTLQVTVRSSQIALENLTAAESRIRDTDFAKETSQLTRAQILVNAGTSSLALANSSAQQVLSLLG